MKVLLLNGSPNKNGCTYTALQEVAQTLQTEGIRTEVFQMGNQPLSGCIACRKCYGKGRCVFADRVNELIDAAESADGIIVGSPVYYASANGTLTSFLDRAFYAGSRGNPNPYAFKPAACVVSARRAGTTATLDQLNKYFTITQMPIISSQYWNMVHGNTPDEVRQDGEGLQIMRTLARNMAFFLKCKEAGLQAGVSLPEQEPRIGTNFIR